MSNNLFRKGLVAATITGLAAAAFAGAPAFAATGDTVLLSSALGTSTNYNGLLSQQFSINDLNSFSAAGHLWVKVSGAVAANVAIGRNDSTLPTTSLAVTTDNAGSATPGSAVGNHNLLSNSYVVPVGTAGAIVTGTAAAQKLDGTGAAPSTDTSFAVDLGAASTNYSHLAFALRNITATTALTITAWVDNGVANGVVDANEVAASQTINFIKDSTVTATTTLTQPVIPVSGNGTVKATVSLDNNINLAQAASGVTVAFTKNGAQATANPAESVTFDATAGNLTTGAVAASAVVSAATYGAQAKVNGTASGSADLRTVVAAVVADAGKLVPATGANVVSGGSNVWTVRSGTTSLVLTDTLKDSTTAAVPAGKVVSVTVTPTVDATSVISAGGTTNAAGSTTAITFTTTTDANGAISVNLGNTIGKNLDSVTVALTSEGFAGTTQTINWADATYSLAANTTGRSVVIGGTYTGTWTVADQFGIAPADGKYVVQVSRPANTPRATVLYTTNAAVVAGVATVALVDAGTITGSDTISAGLYPVLAGGAIGSISGSATSFTLTYATAASVTPTAVTASVDHDGTAASGANAAQPLNLAAPVATNTALPNSPAAALYTAGSDRTLTFSVQQITGANIAGTPVTVTAPGIAFVSGTKHTIGSYTTTTTGADQNVTVYSTLAGKQTFTVTAGGVSKTVSITFAAAAATSGANLVVAAPATAKPGSTVAVTATLTDKFGNPVATSANFKLSTAGVGATTAVTATGADGVATAYVTLGASDLGTITVTGTYTDGSTPAVTLTKTASVVVAAPAAAKNTVAVAASQAQVGAAVDVTATAVDAAGKPAAGVVVSFTVAGQGYLSTASATTNAAGVATVKLVSNVAGMNTVSAAANGVATAATAAVTFGNADANITFNSNKRRATATYEFAGNAKVVISVNGARVKTLYPADDQVGSYSVSLKKGKNKVSVSVAGVTTDSHTVTTK